MSLLVVNYHYIVDESSAYTKGIYPVSLSDLEAQINEISKIFSFVSLSDVVTFFESGQYPDRPSVLITFDDGLKEQMLAYEYLNKIGVPAVFFVNSSSAEGKLQVVHKIHYLLSQISARDIYHEISKNIPGLESKDINEQVLEKYKYGGLIENKLKWVFNFYLNIEETDRVLNELYKYFNLDAKKYAKHLYMDSNDIKKIALFNQLGTHSHSHIPLGMYKREEIHEDINTSINYFNQLGIKKPLAISYPYGDQRAISGDLFNVAEDLGIKVGLTMKRGINLFDSQNHPLQLKRITCNDAPGGKNVNPAFWQDGLLVR